MNNRPASMKKIPIILKYGRPAPVEKAGQLSGIVDVQYAGSRLGDYSGSWITGAITTVMNEQQARLGRFLTYKQKLADLMNRAVNIKSVNSSTGSVFAGRVKSAQTNQSALESQGINLIVSVSTIQKNPIVKMLLREDLNQKDLSTDLIARGSDLIAQLRAAMSQSITVNNELTKHEKVVMRIEKDIISVEGELAGRGVFTKAGKGLSTLLAAPTTMLKYGAVIAGVGAAIYFLPGMLKKGKK